MDMRKMVLDLVTIAKVSSITDDMVRYNPLYYNRVSGIIRKLSESPQVQESTIPYLLDRALSRARKTQYGKKFTHNLADWPVLLKPEVLADPLKFKRPNHLSIPATTGGSTGQPLRISRSLECVAAEQAFIDSFLSDQGRPLLRRKVAVLRADYVKDPADQRPPFGVWRNRRRKLILSNAHLTRANASWFLETLSIFQPDILWVYPTALLNLLRFAEETGFTISIPTILSSSEVLSQSLFKYAQQYFQANVIDYYGQAERVCIARSHGSRGYRFEPAYGHVELILDPPDVCSDRLCTARIIATGYWNSAFPLVRYDTGDRAIVPSSSDTRMLESIAQGKESFLGIVGRSDDYVIGRDEQRITGMNHIPRGLDKVFRVQIVQDSASHIQICVLSPEKLTDRDRRTLEKNARELLPPYMNLNIMRVDKLMSLTNGKTPFIVRRVAEEA